MIKVLSYNIYWKNITTVINIAEFIESNSPYDFVSLQEALNWKDIRRLSRALSNMEVVNNKPGIEDMVTFYDKNKYILDATNNKILGHMSNIDRPFMILFFNEKLCIINVHADHNGDIKKFDEYLIRTIKDNYSDNTENFVQKLQSYDIVMMGDFNDTLKDNDKHIILSDPFFNIPNGRTLYGVNKSASCCDSTMKGKVYSAYDHILSTYQNNNSKVHLIKKASDHLPIIANIYTTESHVLDSHALNIGYDFDGVLHTNVSSFDSYGQRHPLNYNYIDPKFSFDAIINQIDNEINLGYNIFIVTARDSDSLNTIINFLKTTKLDNKIPVSHIYFTKNQNKINILNKLNINIFYDDSCLRVIELYNANTAGKLPELLEIYLVDPKNKSWKIINDQNISAECDRNSMSKLPEIMIKSHLEAVNTKTKNLIDELNKQIDSMAHNIHSKEIEKITNNISDVIQKNNLKITDLRIKKLLVKMNNILDMAVLNENYSKKIVKEINEIQYEILQLIINSLNELNK